VNRESQALCPSKETGGVVALDRPEKRIIQPFQQRAVTPKGEPDVVRHHLGAHRRSHEIVFDRPNKEVALALRDFVEKGSSTCFASDSVLIVDTGPADTSRSVRHP